MLGALSAAELLTVGPRFTGFPHLLSTVGRFVTQRSLPPNPPGRLEPKYSSNPSAEILGEPSLCGLLTIAPRFVGVPKVKSASAIPTVKANTKSRMIENSVFVFLFIDLPSSFTAINEFRKIHVTKIHTISLI
jgi:hypothetical protein